MTEEGKYLAQQAENILNMTEQTTQQLIQMQTNTVKGTLALGVTETCSANILSAMLPEFSKLYPLVSYDIWSGSSNDVCQRIEQGVADIGIVRDPPELNSFDLLYLKDEAWIAVVSRRHPLAESAVVTLEQLCCEALFIPSRQPLKTEIRQWFSTTAKSATIMGYYNQISSIIPLIIQNMGAAICPESVRRYTDDRQVAYLKIEKPEHMSRLYIISARNRLLPSGGKAFWSFVEAHSDQIVNFHQLLHSVHQRCFVKRIYFLYSSFPGKTAATIFFDRSPYLHCISIDIGHPNQN